LTRESEGGRKKRERGDKRERERVRNGVIIRHLNNTAINRIREERERASDGADNDNATINH
jgi:hypothetical protein